MKYYRHLFILIFISLLRLPAQWQLQNPYPTPTNINKVFFINKNIGWIVGDNGTILKTNDGGSSWIEQESNTNKNLYSVYFFDLDMGFAGGGSYLLKTTDGGDSWTEEKFVNSSIIDIIFLDEQVGFFITYDYLFKTIDGGLNWEEINIDSLVGGHLLRICDIDFINSANGWIVGFNPNFVLKTTNQGENWVKVQNVPDTVSFTFIEAIDSTSFWVGGTTSYYDGGDVYLSEDDGNTFSIKDKKSITNLAIVNDSSAVGIGRNNTIKVTKDRGHTWTREPIYDWYDFNDVFFINGRVGWVVGENGLIYKTIDCGNSWEKIFIGTHDMKLGLHFVNENFGCVAGYQHVITTSDGGENWQKQDSLYFRGYGSVFFIDSLYGWATGLRNWTWPSGAEIHKTTDGGNNWQVQSGPHSARATFFINRNVGWAIGGYEDYDPTHGGWSDYYGFIFKTTDGGENWIQYGKTYSNILTSVYFVDSLKGWIGSKGGNPLVSLRTTDGGNTWLETEYPTNANSIFFTDSLTGYAVGGPFGNYSRTIDGGITWVESTIYPTYSREYYSVFFSSNEIGWIVGEKGEFYKTVNGGDDWNPINIGTNLDLYDVYFVSNEVGWICGDNGLIMKTTNGGITFIEEENNPSFNNDFVLEQNYPNPFNAMTTIGFSIPKPSFIKISIYNILGQLVKIFSNKYYSSGNYKLTIDANGLSSGVYIYRLESKDKAVTKKFVLIK